MDTYANFSELKRSEKEHEDYVIHHRNTQSQTAIMAPHGGGIEPGTIDIADAIAGCDHTFYAFKGIKKTGNRTLHITSSRYDEPLGLKTAQTAVTVITVHGCRDPEEMTFIGGRHQHLKQALMTALQKNGFQAVISDVPGIRGISPDNICNRCKSGQGVQLELSRGLRKKLFDHLDRRSLKMKTKAFYIFVKVIRASIP